MKIMNDPDLYAWLGEDELGSNEIGLKQALCAAGIVPLVSVKEPRMSQFVEDMQAQSNQYGKTIRLIRYVPEEILITVKPNN